MDREKVPNCCAGSLSLLKSLKLLIWFILAFCVLSVYVNKVNCSASFGGLRGGWLVVLVKQISILNMNFKRNSDKLVTRRTLNRNELFSPSFSLHFFFIFLFYFIDEFQTANLTSRINRTFADGAEVFQV
jgi:hypothetical protein